MGHPFQSIFNLRQHEILPVALAVLYFFCVLTALMVLRPARESLGRGRSSPPWSRMEARYLIRLRTTERRKK